MKVTITEKYQNGVYLKAATTIENGTERLLAAVMCWGVRFADRLSKLQDGLYNVHTIEIEGDTFKMKGVLELDTPVVAPSNQEVEVA